MERPERSMMNLAMFLQPTGRGWAWRSPRSRIEDLWKLDLPLEMTLAAERAKLDTIFLGNWLAWEGGEIGQQPFTAGYEPLTLIAGMAARTSRIGLIGTSSTTFEYPFNAARLLSSIDWLSKGRVGWNVVTSTSGAEYYGMELPSHEERYARADEYLQVAYGFWDAWDDDAVVNDREKGRWALAERIHPIDHQGKYFKAKGQLFMHRSPQGRPVIVQAGQSAQGIQFAARHAELVFTAQTDVEAARSFRAELKERAAAEGRDSGSVKVLPGIMPVIAATAEEAHDLEAQLNAWTPLEAGLERAAETLQADLTGLDPDRPIPPERLRDPEKASIAVTFGSRYRNFYHMAVVQKMTLREIIARTDRNIGHNAPVGTVSEVADLMQDWFESGACDGFAMTPTAVPELYDAICETLVPELQARGLARTEYEGTTLRDHLGLKRPSSPLNRTSLEGARS